MAFLKRTFVVFLYIAWTKVELTTQETVEVYLGDSAQILCQYNVTDGNNQPSDLFVQWFVRPDITGSWTLIFYGDDKEQEVLDNTDYSDRINVTLDHQEAQLTIQNVQLSDNRQFICHVQEKVFGFAVVTTDLNRSQTPPDAPVIKDVMTGISVTNEMPSKVASCEVRNSFPEPNITWYKNSMPLMSSAGHANVSRDPRGFFSVQSTLEYKAVREDEDAYFSCEVSFFVPGGVRTLESNSVNITVYYPSTKVEMWRESPQGLVKEGDTVELRCHGDGNPPPSFIFHRKQVSFTVRGVISVRPCLPPSLLSNTVGLDIGPKYIDQDVDLESSGHVLILSPVSRNHSGIYQCRPLDSDEYADVKGEIQLPVHFLCCLLCSDLDPAVVVPKDSEVMLKGEDLTATCNALSSLKTHTVWYKDGKQVGTGNTLHLQDATYGTTGQYHCEVSAPSFPALHSSGSVHIIVRGQWPHTGKGLRKCFMSLSKYMCVWVCLGGPQLVGEDQEVQLEEAIGRMVNLSCEAEGSPLPSISWNIIGTQVTKKAHDTALTCFCVFVSPQNWKEVVRKSNEYVAQSVVSVNVTSDIRALCNVSNDVGTEVKAFNIKAIPSVTTPAPFTPGFSCSLCLCVHAAKGSGVIIVVIILCLLLLAISSVLYFLYRKGIIPPGRSGNLDITSERTPKDDVIEMVTLQRVRKLST
ncbi:cell surface glycoprotein MUC18-like [Channa argus]|uniref:cell surface glycoprotein MUC18-like n=1 Tax=Channa argus TaxID=215402 RepID=UPI003520CF86